MVAPASSWDKGLPNPHRERADPPHLAGMPLSPSRDWSCTLLAGRPPPPSPTKQPKQPKQPKQRCPDPKTVCAPLTREADVIGFLAAAAIGGFIANLPLFGIVAGGLGAVATLRWCSLPRFWALWPDTSAPSPVEEEQQEQEHVLSIGADGLLIMGMFHPWISVRAVSADEHLRVNFCDGREWYLRTAVSPQEIAEDARGRMRWAENQSEEVPSWVTSGGYREPAHRTHGESAGLPLALRVGEEMESRVENYGLLDERTKDKVRGSMVDHGTRFRFARSDLGLTPFPTGSGA